MEILKSPEFWILLAFLAFVGVIAKKGYRKITEVLDKRSAAIRDELDEAERLREEAQALLADYRKKQRAAAEETEAILAQARAAAERKSEQAKADLDTFVRRRAELARQAISRAEAKALKEVRDAAVDAALAATAELIKERLDEKRADEMIDHAISEVSKKLH